MMHHTKNDADMMHHTKNDADMMHLTNNITHHNTKMMQHKNDAPYDAPCTPKI